MAFLRLLALGWCLALIVVSLYPFVGWQAPVLPVFDYLTEPWPRYYRSSEMLLNLLFWLPAGFLLAISLPPRRRARLAAALAVLICALLSFSIETVQNFLANRIASNVDLCCNTLGAAIGAELALAPGHSHFVRHSRLRALRRRYVTSERAGDWGVLLFIAWLFTQALPDTPPFAQASLLTCFGLPAPVAFHAHTFQAFKIAAVALGLLSTGLFAACLLPERCPPARPVLLLLALALLVKLAATAWLTSASAFSALSQAANLIGIGMGAPLLALLLWLCPPRLQYTLAGLAGLTATAVFTLMPDNPYVPLGSLWLEPDFLQGQRILLLFSSLWPCFALVWLIALGLHRPREVPVVQRKLNL